MEKWLFRAWAITGALSLLVFSAPDLIVIGFIFLILPGMILLAMPTVFLYLSLFSGPWFLLRQRGPLIASLAGLSACAFTGFQLPQLLNSVTNGNLARLSQLDKVPAQAPSTLTRLPLAEIVLEFPAHMAGRLDCDELCQTILYNDIATFVEVRSATPSSKSVSPRRYRVDRESCAMPEAIIQTLRSNPSARWSTQARAKEISSAVRQRIAGEECRLFDSLAASKNALLVRFLDENERSRKKGWVPRPKPVSFQGVEVVLGKEVIARETRRTASFYSLPLHLIPISSGLGFGGWQWSVSHDPETSKTVDRLEMLQRLTTWELDVPWRGGKTPLPQQIDRLLSDSSRPPAAFLMLTDYFELLGKLPLDLSDRQRLVRLILDERVEDFSYFQSERLQKLQFGATLRDALLERLISEQLRDNAQLVSRLDSIAGSLAPGAYSDAPPLLDQLLSAPVHRRYYPHLIRRLADQGQTGGEKLLTILSQSWAPPNRGFPWGRDGEAAVEGLCMLGPAAADLLPRLAPLTEKFSEVPFFQGLAWRGLLVALGANPAGFPSPNRTDSARYQSDLQRAANACTKKAVPAGDPQKSPRRHTGPA